uniref:energy coupling factor transporter S component ThiW n=1 Tax=Tetragenococcus halophilus TaxID=51669 RepID=UPI003AF3213F
MLTYLAIMIALDVVLSPILRIEGMAPMSSVINVFAGVLIGPLYATMMAFICGIIGSLLSYPVMVVFTGASSQFYWFLYTPHFLGAAVLGSIVAWFV